MRKEIRLKDGSVMAFDGDSATVTFDNKQIALDGAVARAVNDALLDAEGVFFFQRQLELIKSKSYDVRYPELQARKLFPVSNEGGRGINAITYRTYDQSGAAKIINAYADDLPRADVAGKETTIPVRSVGTSYGFNIDEIQSSEMSGAGLDQRRANAAMRTVEQTTNDVAFYGDAESGLPGLFTNPNIPTGAVVNAGSGTNWVNKTPEQIAFDINDLFAGIFETTKMAEQGDTLLVPPTQWAYIMTTRSAPHSDTTIAEYVAKNSPYLTSMDDIIAVNECAAANNPTLTADAMVAYDRNPDKLQLEIPVELEMLPAQFKNLEFLIPGRSRLAGLNIYYPLSLAIATGV